MSDKLSGENWSLERSGSAPFGGYSGKIDTKFLSAKATKEYSGANRYGVEKKFQHKNGVSTRVETSVRYEKGQPGFFVGLFFGN